MTTLPTLRRTLAAAAFLALVCAAQVATAQLSLASAVDLALRNSPHVKSAEADVARAKAVLSQSKDVFIPAVNAGAAIGQAYGYSNYPPTLFNIGAQSLVYNSSQFSYIHSARAGLDAAQDSLQDVRETVAEDAALAFVALDHDQERAKVLQEQYELASKLQSIVQDRFDAGLDPHIDLTNAMLSVKQLNLARIRAAMDTENDRNHLASLLGIPPGALQAEGGFPTAPISPLNQTSSGGYANASVASAFANARAKELQARGDAKFLYRPQMSLASQFNRYATFTNAWKDIENEYTTAGQKLGANEFGVAVQINIPLLDKQRGAKALESAAEASKALHDAEFAQMNVLDAQGKLSRNLELLHAQIDVAALEQQRAQDQLEIVQTQLANADSAPVPLTPKDLQNARIAERDKYLGVVDGNFQLHQAEISLLRQTGHLQDWLIHSVSSAAPQPTSTTVKNP